MVAERDPTMKFADAAPGVMLRVHGDKLRNIQSLREFNCVIVVGVDVPCGACDGGGEFLFMFDDGRVSEQAFSGDATFELVFGEAVVS